MKSGSHSIRLAIGIILSMVFMYLALRKVDFGQMADAFRTANYGYLLLAIPILFSSHFLRAFRWRYLLDPIERFDTRSLFSSLMIGYMANTLMPARLGEFLRAYVLSRKRRISGSAAFATIVMERIIDVFALLALMIFAMFIYPFPGWVKYSGYIMLLGSAGLFMFLILLKKKTSRTRAILSCIITPLPASFGKKIDNILETFLAGIVPLKNGRDYFIVSVLSLLIWACYGFIFYFTLQAFDFVKIYELPWSTSLILLVITTIGIVIPSSPGYVGTYHYLCQISLALFGVAAGPALSFAAVVHAVNFLPILLVGLFFAYHEGTSISKMRVPSTASEAFRPEASEA